MMKFAMMLAATAFTSGTAVAEPVVVTKSTPSLPTEVVSYADLNLGSAAGQTRLQRRIGAAAARVCSFDYGGMGLDEFVVTQACFKSARADGMRQMSELLAARSSGANLAAASLSISRK
jgi:UrcA family protein